MRLSLAALLSLSSFLAFAGPASAADAPAKRPNFLLVFLDDMRYDAMSCAGHPFAKTPNMDRLAREGAYCRNSFVAISLCSPSRACFLTGQYAHRHGVMRNNGTDLKPDAVTWPRELQKAGYQTGWFGKLHMAPSDEKRPGFDYWVSYKGQGIYIDPPMNINGERVKARGYIDDLTTDEMVKWLTKVRDKSRPFGAVLAFKSTHGPFTPPDRCKDLYTGAEIKKPATANEPLENKPAFIRKWIDTEIQMHMKFPYEEFILNYNRAIRGSDDNLGRVLKTLEEEGILDDTCVVFSSDNGYYQGEHGGLFDKRSAYEESLRVPMLVRYPRLIKANTQVQEMVLNIDVGPTFLDLAGVPIPKEMQGRSMTPVLSGKAENWRHSFFYEYFREKPFINTPTIQAVRTDRFKLIRYLEPVYGPEVYDLVTDPRETKNLYASPDHATIVRELEAELDRLIRETEAGVPAPMPG